MVGAALLGLGSLSAPARAVQSYTIHSPAPAWSGANTFEFLGCNPTVASAVNGTDTVIIDISDRADKDVTVTWSAAAKQVAQNANGGLDPSFFTSVCGEIGMSVPGSGPNGPTWTFHVPPGSQWLAITSVGLVEVSLSV
jgi:hypothetical protein